MIFEDFSLTPPDDVEPQNNPLVLEALCLIGVTNVPNQGPAEQTDQQRQIADLIGRNGLGSGNFQTRERAFETLRGLGPLAQEQLIANISNPDVEIARRSRALLEPLLANSSDRSIATLMLNGSPALRDLLRQEIISNRLTIPDERDIHRTFRSLIADQENPFTPENVRLLEQTYRRTVDQVDRMTEDSASRISMLGQFLQNEQTNHPDNEFTLQQAQDAVTQWRSVSAGTYRGLVRYEYAQTMNSMGDIPRRNALMMEALTIHPELAQRHEFTRDVLQMNLDRDPMFTALFRQSGGNVEQLRQIRERMGLLMNPRGA